MKIEDMVMVIYNQKGIEKNFLCSFEHFIKKYATDACDSYFEMAEVAAGLQETKQKHLRVSRSFLMPSMISLWKGTVISQVSPVSVSEL